MRTLDPRRLLVLLALVVFALPASAGSFAESHPDQYFRARAAAAVKAGKMTAAIEAFKQSARYGDKPSQLALALAYWNGEGVATNRPLGYVWADLAAERGIKSFVSVRERMWAQMTEAEQAAAVEQGKAYAKEYQDSVAQPRMARKLRHGARQKTGSRTGSSVYSTGVSAIDPAARAALSADLYSAILGNVGPEAGQAGLDADGNAMFGNTKPEVSGGVVGGNYSANMVKLLGVAFQAADRHSAMGYYDPENWDPKLYFKARDAPWRDLPVGAVTVGPLQPEG